MDVYLNLWGGEGYLTAASFLALASIGVYDGLTDSADGQQVNINYGCYDFTGSANYDLTRCNRMYEAYKKYYCGIINEGKDSNIVKVNTTISNMVTGASPMKLENKYSASRECLAFGCNKADMTTDLSQGIYGKPWVGEAYYADSRFDSIYTTAHNSIVVINCGGYKGGGTAASFIPLENSYDPRSGNTAITNVERFNIIVGPSTQFNRMVRYSNPGIYTNPQYDNGVDLFDIPNVVKKLNGMVKSAVSDESHKKNVSFLNEQYEMVFNPEAHGGPIDRRSLNPVNYMTRFVDRVDSDSTMKNAVKANFINLKPNLSVDANGYFNYDVTSELFQPDQQKHSLHITNLLSAVEVQEIASHHNNPNYSDGKIYAFQYDSSNKFTLDGVFLPEDVKKVIRFAIFSMLITDYAYNCFNDIRLPGTAVMLDKWAITTGIKHTVATTEGTKEGDLNIRFANTAKKELINLAHEYIEPTLQALIDVEETCSDVNFFSYTPIGGADGFAQGVYGIIKSILGKIVTLENGEPTIISMNDANVIKQNADKCTAALVMGRFNYPDDFNGCLNTIIGLPGGGFLNSYQNSFPQFGKISGLIKNRNWDSNITEANVDEYAKKYCKEIIRNTYSLVCDTFR